MCADCNAVLLGVLLRAVQPHPVFHSPPHRVLQMLERGSWCVEVLWQLRIAQTGALVPQ